MTWGKYDGARGSVVPDGLSGDRLADSVVSSPCRSSRPGSRRADDAARVGGDAGGAGAGARDDREVGDGRVGARHPDAVRGGLHSAGRVGGEHGPDTLELYAAGARVPLVLVPWCAAPTVGVELQVECPRAGVVRQRVQRWCGRCVRGRRRRRSTGRRREDDGDRSDRDTRQPGQGQDRPSAIGGTARARRTRGIKRVLPPNQGVPSASDVSTTESHSDPTRRKRFIRRSRRRHARVAGCPSGQRLDARASRTRVYRRPAGRPSELRQ